MFIKVSQLALVALCFSAALAQTDLTLEERQKGEAVVDVVVDRCMFVFGYDFKFMKRVALVESYFGEDPDTYESDTTGGIWKLRQGWYNLTNPGNQAMVQAKAMIESQFGVKWNTDTKYESLIKPLLSAFATRLWLMVVNEAIPNNLPGQAAFWNKHMKSNATWTEADFIRIVTEFENAEVPVPCNAPMDVCLVLDSSGSIGAADFQNVRNFSGELIKDLDLEFVRPGVVYYSSASTRYINLNETWTSEQLLEAIAKMPYVGGSTNTNAGINDAVDMFNETGRRDGAPQIMVVVTDGYSDAGVPDMIRAEELGIESFAVGVGDGPKMSELLEIAGGDPTRIYSLGNFVELAAFFGELAEETCEAPQLPEIGEDLNGTLVQNEKRFYKMGIPEDGVTVYYTVESGSFKAYAARGELTNQPNEVVHEVELTPNDDGFYFPYKEPGSTRLVRGARAEENVIYIGLQGKEATNEYTLISENGVSTNPPETSTPIDSTNPPETSTPIDSTSPPETSTPIDSTNPPETSTPIISPPTDSTMIPSTTGGVGFVQASFAGVAVMTLLLLKVL